MASARTCFRFLLILYLICSNASFSVLPWYSKKDPLTLPALARFRMSYFVVEVIFSNSSTFSYNIKKRFPFFEVLYFRFPSWYSKSPFWTRRVRYSFIWLKEMNELYIILVIPAPPSWVADFKIAATMSVLLLYFNIHIIWQSY